MTTKQQTVDLILEQLAAAGGVAAKRMFGEFGLYREGKLFALVCDDRLFVKPTQAGRAFAPLLDEGIPYSGAKPQLVVPGDFWEDSEWLVDLIKLTADALPRPATKKLKASKTK